jgi:hypothetical protein
MSPMSTAFIVGAIGVAAVILSFRSPWPHRLSLMLLGIALVVGPVAPLLISSLRQRTASWTAIGLALIAIANSGLALLRRTDEMTRHS